LLDLKAFTDDRQRLQMLERVAFSPDGTRIFARSYAKSGKAWKAWDARTGQELQGEEIPQTLPNEWISPDGHLLAHAEGNRVELVSLKPDAEELDYRRLHTQPTLWRYRESYLAARAVKDPNGDFAAGFYLGLIPPADRPALVARADLNALAPLSERAQQHLSLSEWDQALPLLVEIMTVRKARLGPEDPDTLEAMARLGEVYRKTGQSDKSAPLFEELLKVRAAKLGRDHADTLSAVAHLGVSYKEAGRLREAIPLLEEAHR